jgi:hypothetical protein
MAVEGKGKVADLSSSRPSGAAGKGAVAPPSIGKQADATVSRPAAAKRLELADRVPAMMNARGWGIFAGLILSWLLLASVVVLFATHWT